jgi:hypothetical protein
MLRCCSAIKEEFEPCYASILVAPSGLKSAVEELENGKLKSSITSWCNKCKKCSLIVEAIDAFSCPSAHHVHALVLSGVIDNIL